MRIDTSLRALRVATYYTVRATFPNGSSAETEHADHVDAVAQARNLEAQGVKTLVTRFDMNPFVYLRDGVYDETRVHVSPLV